MGIGAFTGGHRLLIRSLNRRDCPSWTDRLFRLISHPMKFPPQAVIGCSSAASIGATALHGQIACFG
jgi:hypothetical protein